MDSGFSNMLCDKKRKSGNTGNQSFLNQKAHSVNDFTVTRKLLKTNQFVI